MQHNQSPTAAAAPAPGSRSCCDQQANDLAAYAHCRTQAHGDDEQHPYMQSKLSAANDHVSLRTNYHSQNNCYLLPHNQILVHGSNHTRKLLLREGARIVETSVLERCTCKMIQLS
jgi:hypothetical protein